jgi:hypothetical protein
MTALLGVSMIKPNSKIKIGMAGNRDEQCNKVIEREANKAGLKGKIRAFRVSI